MQWVPENRYLSSVISIQNWESSAQPPKLYVVSFHHSACIVNFGRNQSFCRMVMPKSTKNVKKQLLGKKNVGSIQNFQFLRTPLSSSNNLTLAILWLWASP